MSLTFRSPCTLLYYKLVVAPAHFSVNPPPLLHIENIANLGTYLMRCHSLTPASAAGHILNGLSGHLKYLDSTMDVPAGVCVCVRTRTRQLKKAVKLNDQY